MMIDRRGQLGDFLAWRADARLAVAVREAEQGALVRDIEAAFHEREAVGRVEILDEGRAQFRLPVVIAVTQQRDAVTAFDAALAETLDIARNDVLGPELRSMAARAFRDAEFAVRDRKDLRSEERRVVKEFCSTFISWCSPYL